MASPFDARQKIKIKCRTVKVLVDDGDRFALKVSYIVCDKEGETNASMNDRFKNTTKAMALYGICCREMTCPFFVFTLFVSPKNGTTCGLNNFDIVSIVGAHSHGDRLSKQPKIRIESLKKMIRDSEYFRGDPKMLSDPKCAAISRDRILRIAIETEILSKNQFVEDSSLPLLRNKEAIYATKNMFRREEYFLLMNSIGPIVANELTDDELTIACNIVVYNKGVQPHSKQATDRLFEKMCFAGKIKGKPLQRFVSDCF